MIDLKPSLYVPFSRLDALIPQVVVLGASECSYCCAATITVNAQCTYMTIGAWPALLDKTSGHFTTKLAAISAHSFILFWSAMFAVVLT